MTRAFALSPIPAPVAKLPKMREEEEKEGREGEGRAGDRRSWGTWSSGIRLWGRTTWSADADRRVL